jgi:hypothetical protein
MMGGKGLSRQGGIRGTEISVESNKRKPRDYDLLPLSGNDAFANCVEHELRRIMQVQFLQDVAAMSLDRVGANVQGCCYFLVRLPFSQELQDLSLTAREQVIGIYGAFLLENTDVVLRQDAAHFRAEK